MKKRFFALILAAILGVQGMGGFTVNAADIPEDCETIEFDKRYWAEPGETYWYKFEAPAPKCVFTDMQIDGVGDWLYGWDVTSHRYYDENGTELGTISSTNDPDVSEWTEFEVGKTYYIKVTALKEGTFYTLSPIREAEPASDIEKEGYKGKKRLELTGENVEKFIAGNTNTKWDVYTVTEEFTAGEENVITGSDFFVLPYKVCFDESQLSVEKRTTTYTTIDHTAQTSWDSLAAFVKKPYSGTENVVDGGYVQAANHYACAMDGDGSGKAERSCNVFVPTGKRIKLADDGCFYPLPVNERFTDVSAKAWYTEAVSWASENKFMNGTGDDEFSPVTPLTRAQFVMILANIEGADLSVYKDVQSFSDVPKGRWYSTAVEWAKDKGVTSGVSDNRFAPNDKVTRQQLARFLCTYAELRSIDMPEGAELSVFTDENRIADWAKDSMRVAVAAGLVTGMTESTLAPRENATRAQISLIIKRFYEGYLRAVTPAVETGSYLLEGGTCGYSFYDELITLSGKENPHVLYIGMACADPTEGWGAIKSEMCTWRGCTTDILLLEDLPTDNARQKIEAADIIYVTGGNSRMLLERLRRYGTDELIRRAAAEGTVMSGSSAGAICFGAYGTSGIRDDRFENIYGTGCVDVIVCPHGNEAKRVEEMKRLILKDATLVGVAVDYACLEISGGMYRIYTEEGYHKLPVAIRYWNEDGKIKFEDINSMEWRPIDELYNP
ncbi:MAG: S-layer homology domain-containing protein [Clostridia bacterium]|nr:S-layer homology domain-containing protein [Clostridia bacterium]